MRTTITIRTDEVLRSELEKRAESTGRTLSEVVREILESAMARRSIKARTFHVRGRLKLPKRDVERWRRKLRQRNWRT